MPTPYMLVIDTDIETLFNVENIHVTVQHKPSRSFISTNICKLIKSNRIYHSMHKYKHNYLQAGHNYLQAV